MLPCRPFRKLFQKGRAVGYVETLGCLLPLHDAADLEHKLSAAANVLIHAFRKELGPLGCGAPSAAII